MPFASFKNIQKRNAKLHRERAQPGDRKKFGLLPKKKDFIQRSKDDESKRSKIRELKKKALTKNTDEFYFAMNNSKHSTEKGHILLNAEKEYTDDHLNELLSQDILFLRREFQIEKSKIREMESRLNLLPGDPSITNKCVGPKRTIFVDSVEEARKVKANVQATHIPTRYSSNLSTNDVASLNSLQLAGYQELSERLDRAEKLKIAIQKRESKNLLLKNKDAKFKVESKATKNHAAIYKFEHKRYK